MRILHVIDGLGGSGGAERRFVEELEAWPEADEHRVLRLFDYDDLSARIEQLGTEVRPLGFDADRGSWTWPAAVVRIAREIRRFDPSVVHTSLFHADLAGQWAAHRCRVPVVSSIVRSTPESPSRRVALLDRLRYATARRTKARWRAVTAAAADSAVAVGADPAAITVVRRGIRVPAVPPAPEPERFGLAAGQPLVVHVARQAWTKGQPMLVDAIARVKQDHPDVQLVVAGRRGDASTAVRAAVERHGLGGSFHDIGFLQDPTGLLACATVVVRPSTEEGFAAGILEAVAMRRPVIASDIPPHREVAADLDLATFAPVGDPVAWADVLAGLLEHPPSEDDLEARAARARAAYSTEAAARGLRELLCSVARESSP
jgi:glycosyltransferase involved in cell wall biosynthesis